MKSIDIHVSTIDTFILKKFQHIADLAQNRFSITNFTIARKVIDITCFLFVPTVVVVFIEMRHMLWPLSIPAVEVMLNCVIILFFIWWANKSLAYCEENTEKDGGSKNKAEIEYYFFRILFLCIFICVLVIKLPSCVDALTCIFVKTNPTQQSLIHVGQLFLTILYILPFIFIYFVSCTPKKPKKVSKVKNEEFTPILHVQQ